MNLNTSFKMGLILTAVATMISASAADQKDLSRQQKRDKLWARMQNRKPPKDLIIPEVEARNKIGFVLYTVSHKTLKLTAHLYPLKKGDSRDIKLEAKLGGSWKEVAKAEVRDNDYKTVDSTRAWNALFRVEKWDTLKDIEVRVVALDGVAKYAALIRKDPVDKKEIVVAAFTGNSNRDRGPREDVVKNVLAQKADLLFFSGDQSYDHLYHYRAWMLFGRQFGELTRQAPSVCLPDDHDVGQGNVWGSSGKVASSSAGNDGGFFMPVEYVNEVYFAQTAHMPDAYDPTPVERNIGVCYGSLNVGGIDFAIIEDRKFKSGPAEFINDSNKSWKGRVDHIGDAKIDPMTVDFPEAKLLGDRQLKFLNAWGKDWDGAVMKCVLSQTVLANAAHYHGKIDAFVVADMDSNGWPQSGRNRALDQIRRSYSFMLCGDQHLATIIHHGIDEFNDAGWSFCVPSIVNYYNRWWRPQSGPVVPLEKPGVLPYTGSYFDGFKNRITTYAYANPDEKCNITDSKYVKRAAGHGIVRFNKPDRTITMECWPRGSDVTRPDAKQYPGWPMTITQEDNYGRKAVAYLPTFKVEGITDPVVQVIDETNNETVYSLRIKGNSFTPKVFKKGSYTVIVCNQKDKSKTLTKVVPGKGLKIVNF